MITLNKLHTFKLVTLFAAFTQLRAAEAAQKDYKNLSEDEKKSCLISAVKQKNLDTVNALLDAGADPETNSEEFSGNSVICAPVLAIAIEQDATDIAETLINHKADVDDSKQIWTYEGRLFCKSINNLEELINGLKKIINEASWQIREIETPLLALAIKKKNYTIVETLIRHGASIKKGLETNNIETLNHETTITTPLLILAVESECPEIVELLIRHGVDIKKGCTDEFLLRGAQEPICKDGELPLAKAISRGNEQIILLIKTATEQQNDNAFLVAVKAEDINKVQQLIKAGANINACDQYGMDALHAAAEKGDLELIKILIDAHIDVKEYGGCALVEAAKRNDVPMTKMLIDAGAIDNASAIAYAADKGNEEILKMILDANIFDPTELNWAITNAHSNPSIITLILNAAKRPADSKEPLSKDNR